MTQVIKRIINFSNNTDKTMEVLEQLNETLKDALTKTIEVKTEMT
jgi:hypothetical protein